MSLSKTLYPLLGTGSIQEEVNNPNMTEIVDRDMKPHLWVKVFRINPEFGGELKEIVKASLIDF